MVHRRIGSGAFGVVYEAFDRQQNRRVALKVLRYRSADALYRFKKEFRSLAGIRHPALVSFYDLLVFEGLWMVTMELVEEAVDFVSFARAPVAARGGLDFDRVRLVLAQLSEGLAALHGYGRAHRDIKPSNVLVGNRDGGLRVSLLDFGMVTDLAPASYLESGAPSFVGSPAYMSPEQSLGEGQPAAGDWYSVGVMLYQALTGELPYRGSLFEMLRKKGQGMPDDLRSIVPALPGDLEEICRGLMEPDPAARFSSSEILECLDIRSSKNSRPLDRESSSDGNLKADSTLLAALEEAFRSSRRRPVVVCISGSTAAERGSLVGQFLGSIADRAADPPTILSGRCLEHEAVPYKSLDSSIDALSRVLMALPDPELEQLLPSSINSLVDVFPVLERVPAIAATRTALDPADRSTAFEVFHQLLRRAARLRPLVLSLENLQWGDAESLSWLARMLVSPRPPRFLLIASFSSWRSREGTTHSEMFDSMFDECASAGVVEVRTLRIGDAVESGVEPSAKLEGSASSS